ncbi:GNAT family N-acetyltransferase [Lichenihabitans sp. Uapishka_5]|uniref:GNAT family N-acetyltransferase n=1 Tax=Lichenihabitans sp. Uapishka_5 TaxID=3037302 RepID=UPI0029E7D20E|nr:GNAT family N-acetyltransferase [Lichenihabitans sp. Uapishka_5]MDX7949745.1 GNAT family N-acetyltransferase [Lichenihabitans sp. Uapishka_5]
MDIIVTRRLVLRSPVAQDLQGLQDHVLSDPDVMRFAFSGNPLSSAQSKAFFDSNFDHDQTGRKLGVLIERETKELTGFAGLVPCGALGQPDFELGFVLRRDAWGRGYATEIGLGQIEYGFSTLHLKRVLAQVSPKNHGSISTLRKLGMAFCSAVHSEERGERLVYAVHSLSV